jgi:hypothetical protein
MAMAMAMVGLVIVNGKKVLKVESNEGKKDDRRVSIHLPANFAKVFFEYLSSRQYLSSRHFD